jgi:hypothetical protein
MISAEMLRVQFGKPVSKTNPSPEVMKVFAHMIECVVGDHPQNERSEAFAAMCLLWTLIEDYERETYMVGK